MLAKLMEVGLAPSDSSDRELRRRVARLEALLAALLLDGLDDDAPFLRQRLFDALRRDAFRGDRGYLDVVYDLMNRRSDYQNRLTTLETGQSEVRALIERGNAELRASLEKELYQHEILINDLRAKLDSQINDLTNQHLELRSSTHEWLIAQTLGLDVSKVKLGRYVPVRVYLSDTPEGAVEHLSAAISQVLESFEFGLADEFPAIEGSWFKKWYARTRSALTTPEVLDELAKMQRAIELHGLGKPQADIDAKQAEAVASLLKASEKVESAAMQVGSILLIKLSSPSGRPRVRVRTLTPIELMHLENNQRLLDSPNDLLENLTNLCRKQAQPDGTNSKTNLIISGLPKLVSGEITKDESLRALPPPTRARKRRKTRGSGDPTLD